MAANNTKSWKDKVAHHEGLIRLIEPGKLATEKLQKICIHCLMLRSPSDLLKSVFSCSLLVSQQPIDITFVRTADGNFHVFTSTGPTITIKFFYYYYLFIYLKQSKDQPEHCMVWVFNAVSLNANCQKQ